jgi:hypothetical protein
MQAEPSPLNQNIAIIQRVRMMCDLFNLAFEMKSLELERQHRDASPEWIKQETLRLIEAGTR